MTQVEIAELRASLDRLDRAADRPWTRQTLQLLQQRPGVRAADLAARMGFDTAQLEARVRRLKGLGLTESLAVGYRVSVRGRALLRAWTSAAARARD